MAKQNFNIVNFDDFVSLFMREQDDSFESVDNPIKIFPLSIASKYIKTPIPLFRAKYNFILIIKEGGGRQQVDNEFLDLNANDVLFIREGHLNAIKTIKPETVVVKEYYLHTKNSQQFQVL